MTTTVPEDLAQTLDDVVRRVLGVRTLYRSTPVVASIAASLLPARTEHPFVLVGDDDGLTVTVTIAADAPAVATCCAVHDAIVDHLAGAGYEASVVRVTVGHVLE